MPEARRIEAQQLCADAIAQNQPLAWFEQLYTAANGDTATIPWADLEPNPNLVSWHAESAFDFSGKHCLKVGCGLGDDAEYLQAAGGIVTGFDISSTAIAWCQQRFPNSEVTYRVCDLFEAPSDWSRNYEFVLESYTLQVLPTELRECAIAIITNFVAEGGTLLIICRARSDADPPGQMPWPLQRQEVESFGDHGLTLVQLKEFDDNETPPVQRFLAEFRLRPLA